MQRVRRRSFLDDNFKRRGNLALGALDPGLLEALEAKDASAAAQLRDMDAKRKGFKGKGNVTRLPSERSLSPARGRRGQRTAT